MNTGDDDKLPQPFTSEVYEAWRKRNFPDMPEPSCVPVACDDHGHYGYIQHDANCVQGKNPCWRVKADAELLKKVTQGTTAQRRPL